MESWKKKKTESGGRNEIMDKRENQEINNGDDYFVIISLSLSLSLSFFLSLLVCLSVCLCLTFYLSMSVCLTISLILSITVF